MKYPKEYFKKALDLIEREYVTDEGIESTALLALAASCIGAVAFNHKDDWGVTEQEAYYMVRDAVVKPEPYEK